jgi:hypothetical protein
VSNSTVESTHTVGHLFYSISDSTIDEIDVQKGRTFNLIKQSLKFLQMIV